MGQRSRKRGRRQKPAAAVAASGGGRTRATAQEKNAAVRATLTPFRPGERPWPITVGAVLALLSGLVQLILFLVGVKLKANGLHAAAGQTIIFGVLMLVCALGMWRMKYWAVLGFMALLAIVIIIAAGAVINPASTPGGAVAALIVAAGGFLFFKLIRVLSRIQMPKYPGR